MIIYYTVDCHFDYANHSNRQQVFMRRLKHTLLWVSISNGQCGFLCLFVFLPSLGTCQFPAKKLKQNAILCHASSTNHRGWKTKTFRIALRRASLGTATLTKESAIHPFLHPRSQNCRWMPTVSVTDREASVCHPFHLGNFAPLASGIGWLWRCLDFNPRFPVHFFAPHGSINMFTIIKSRKKKLLKWYDFGVQNKYYQVTSHNPWFRRITIIVATLRYMKCVTIGSETASIPSIITIRQRTTPQWRPWKMRVGQIPRQFCLQASQQL